MAISMYQISLPIFVRQLNGEKKYDESTLLSCRFYPDMFSFAKQVQIATDHARNCAALLAGLEAPKYEDNETSLAQLIARVEKTIAYLKTIKPEQVDGAEGKTVIVKMRDREMNFTGLELLQNRSMPNFYFHTTTAYDIIRHNGVEIGKRDFMGAS